MCTPSRPFFQRLWLLLAFPYFYLGLGSTCLDINANVIHVSVSMLPSVDTPDKDGGVVHLVNNMSIIVIVSASTKWNTHRIIKTLQSAAEQLSLWFHCLYAAEIIHDTAGIEIYEAMVLISDWYRTFSNELWRAMYCIYGPDLTPPQRPESVTILVPKFHLPAHIVACQEEFSFAFEVEVGETDGEAPECTWVIFNHVAASTKEMGPGSRQDTLDDHWSDHNWCKNTNIRQYVSSLDYGEILIAPLAKLLLHRIKDTMPHREENRITFELLSEMVVSSGDDALTMASVWLRLNEEGCDAEWGALSGMLISANKMIADGILAKQAQSDLQKDATSLGVHSMDIQRVKVLDWTSCLQREIESWMEVQRVYMPEVIAIRDARDHLAGRDCVVAWNIDLLLPSRLLADHKIVCDKRLLDYEWELRKAQATEALAIVRHKIILETYIMNHKEVYGHGQKTGTASNKLLDACCTEKAWGIAISYHVLKKEDAIPITGLKPKKKRETGKETSGESRAQQLSWIWLTLGAMDSSTPEGLQDGLNGANRAPECRDGKRRVACFERKWREFYGLMIIT
ncbi:hypothetical protein EV421DRAFT_1743608 [Armillaria borealis]|uniref:Uncharacterized protein n=1 Tax=Armillaria borealis TaxID=47425 RepID=A0AA39IUX4_9AGAR|nr:hypothetical protein EV421DRAFT_1743608 [Armillaria borealis]